MSTVPRSPYPDGDRSILGLSILWKRGIPLERGRKPQPFLWPVRPGHCWGDEVPRKNLRVACYCRVATREQAEETDLETQRELLAREIKNGKFGPNCYILNPQEDPAAVKALRAYAAATDNGELGMSLLATIKPLERPEECPFDQSTKALQHLFDTAWNLNTSEETRSQFTQMVTDQLSGIMQDFNFLVENWKLMTGFADFSQDEEDNET